MDWGGKVTYLAQTAFKNGVVPFGIKDTDRLEHISVIGKAKSGRASLLTQMALQDIERGMSVVVLDASGALAPMLAERLSSEAREKLVFLDPSDGEHPFSWNAVEEFRPLGDRGVSVLSEALASIYRVPVGLLTSFVAEFSLSHAETSPLLLYDLVMDAKKREKILGAGTQAFLHFEELLKKETETIELIAEHGRYIAKDTLVRNIVGQKESKFSLAQGEEGSLIIVDLSRIRMFPTRITPLVRLFTHAAHARGLLGEDVSLYLYDSVKYLPQEDIERILPERSIALVMATTPQNEEDMSIRENALKRSGSVVAFASHPNDYSLLEQVFYPYVSPDELAKMKEGELCVILTIDSVRARPFFATLLPRPERSGVSYQDLQVYSLGKYTISRLKADQIFKEVVDDKDKKGKDGDPGFSGAFRSIFAKRAGAGVDATKPVSEPVTAEAKTAPTPNPKETPSSKKDASPEHKELSEEELRNMLYVEPLIA